MTDEGAELKDQRVPLLMSQSEVKAIDDWMFAARIRSRGEAIRRLCQIGIVFHRELKPMVAVVTEHIRATVANERPQLSREEHQKMFQDMAISLFNAGTVLSKLDTESTDEAINALINLYEYYNAVEAEKAGGAERHE
jgi:hypothetical protein